MPSIVHICFIVAGVALIIGGLSWYFQRMKPHQTFKRIQSLPHSVRPASVTETPLSRSNTTGPTIQQIARAPVVRQAEVDLALPSYGASASSTIVPPPPVYNPASSDPTLATSSTTAQTTLSPVTMVVSRPATITPYYPSRSNSPRPPSYRSHREESNHGVGEAEGGSGQRGETAREASSGSSNSTLSRSSLSPPSPRDIGSAEQGRLPPRYDLIIARITQMTLTAGVQRNDLSSEGYTPQVVRLCDSLKGLYRLASVQGDTPIFPIRYLAKKIDRPAHVIRNALILFIFSTLLLDPGGYAPILSRSLLFLAGAWGTVSHITKDPSYPTSHNTDAQKSEGGGVSEGSKAWLDFWIIYTLTTALEEVVGYEVITLLCPLWALVKVAVGGHLIAQAYGFRKREKVHNPRSLTLKMTKTRMATQRPIQPKVVHNPRIPPSEGLIVSHHTLDHANPSSQKGAAVQASTRPGVVDGFASPTSSTNDQSPLSTHSTMSEIPASPASTSNASDPDDWPEIITRSQIHLAKSKTEEFAETSLSSAPINTADIALPTTITIGVDSDSKDTPGSSSFDLDSEVDSPSPSPSPYEPSPHSAMPAGTPVTKGLIGQLGDRADLNRESDGFDSESNGSEGDGEADDAVFDMYIGGKVEPAMEVRV